MSRPPTTFALLAALLLLAAAAAGCMHNESLAPADADVLLDRSFNNLWDGAEQVKLELSGRTIPTRVVLIRESSLATGVVDLAGAADRLTSGAETFTAHVPDVLADLLAEQLRDMAERTQGWAESAEDYPHPWGRQQWAADTASALAMMYRIDRGAAAADPRETLRDDLPPSALLAPVIRSMILMAMQRAEVSTGGEDRLFAELGSQKSLPIEFLLRGAFRLADLNMPDEAPGAVEEVFDEGPPTAVGVEAVLRERLLALRRQAEGDRRPPSSRKVRQVLQGVPRALRVMARLVEQWDKLYLVSLEVGRKPTVAGGAAAEEKGQEIVSLVADVRPGLAVRLDNLHEMAPRLTFRGRTRMNIMERDVDVESGDDTDVWVEFHDDRGGQMAVRFESWVYGLASLFTFPIEDWVIREVIVRTRQVERHVSTRDVTVMMDAREYAEGEDRRRAIHVHTTRRLEVETRGQTVDRRIRHDLVFKYVRPDRLWNYERTWHETLPPPTAWVQK